MKRIIHRLIVAYLRRCGGAFHTFPYGPRGRYIVLMNEKQYNRYMHSGRWVEALADADAALAADYAVRAAAARAAALAAGHHILDLAVTIWAEEVDRV